MNGQGVFKRHTRQHMIGVHQAGEWQIKHWWQACVGPGDIKRLVGSTVNSQEDKLELTRKCLAMCKGQMIMLGYSECVSYKTGKESVKIPSKKEGTEMLLEKGSALIDSHMVPGALCPRLNKIACTVHGQLL